LNQIEKLSLEQVTRVGARQMPAPVFEVKIQRFLADNDGVDVQATDIRAGGVAV